MGAIPCILKSPSSRRTTSARPSITRSGRAGLPQPPLSTLGKCAIAMINFALSAAANAAAWSTARNDVSEPSVPTTRV